MDQCLGNTGFRPIKSDPSVYIYKNEVGFVVLTLYVDELLLLNANKLLLDKLKKQLMDRFEITYMGDGSSVVGVNVTRDREKGTITINQRDYTEDAIGRFSLKGCNPAHTPAVESELPLNQPEKKCWTRRPKSIPIHHWCCHVSSAGFPLMHPPCR